ncbi:cholesterol 7-desaturase nvd-like isoform X2 [Brevipalpus obovatus]|uniref:cholesterol 7-desaturase nvd-like isoform X2 n=1 Tax=Brevipalpus obovatus TaxID=246614 RepID=UPI003D9E54A1
MLRKLLYHFYHALYRLFFGDLCMDSTDADKNLNDTGPYPNGWIPVAETQQLVKGQIMKTQALGQDIVLMRDSNGKVHAMDPYCPHNGAHLGGGDVVKIRGEDCIRCPFHEWSFRAEDGVCVDVPYAKDRKAPKVSKLKVWPCVEVNDFIFIWYHNGGHCPNWFPEPMEEIENGDVVYAGKMEYFANTSVKLISENTSDSAHITIVHGGLSPILREIGKYMSLDEKWLKLNHFSWKPSAGLSKHIAYAEYEPNFSLYGLSLGKGLLSSTQFGPYTFIGQTEAIFLGFDVKFKFTVGLIPIHSNKQKFILRMYSEKTIPSRLGCRLTLIGFLENFHQDALIWKDMGPLEKPITLKEEKPTVDFRRWYQQFYGADEKINPESIES